MKCGQLSALRPRPKTNPYFDECMLVKRYFPQNEFHHENRVNLTRQAKQIYANTPEFKNVHLLWRTCVNIQS